MRLVVTGGHQRRAAGIADRDHRRLYDAAVLAHLDPDSGALEPALRLAGGAGDDPHVGHRFGGVSRDGDAVLVCTEREVLRVDAAGAVLARWTHPWLADVHHALRVDGVLHAVATGADGVVRLVARGGGRGPEFLAVADGIAAPRGDLRRARRPRSPWHANHAFLIEGALFVTRGVAGDAVAIGGGARWPLADVVVHDGLVRPEGVWFTAVDGRLLLVDPRAGRVVRTVFLREPADGDEPLGWCRGVEVVDDVAYVGFTRLRATAARRNLAWIARHLRGTAGASARPTRIEAWNLRTERRIASWPTAAAGLDAIFGVVQAPW